ncbi:MULTISPECIES: hypothetical protein [Corynebacterium]|uniref:hypothetical protein n=1 Tax=Corynebacterium TaxID=1716 RepID=UPI001FED7E66|nr:MULTISPECIES: hypothetical protein [Corynebacterium]MCT1443504.1 hypothetical protein [Corynebacterium glucuronolyticum]
MKITPRNVALVAASVTISLTITIPVPAMAQSTEQVPMSTLDASSADAAHVPGLWRIEQNPDDDAESFEKRAGGSIGPFVMVADNPHFSQGTVSAHGCYTGGPLGGQAIVKNWIERKNANGNWERAATGQPVTVPQGCGRGKRSNARAQCSNFTRTLYRNVVDVDILGAIDPPMKAYKENWVNCGV